jgi:hypothetical protein
MSESPKLLAWRAAGGELRSAHVRLATMAMDPSSRLDPEPLIQELDAKRRLEREAYREWAGSIGRVIAGPAEGL